MELESSKFKASSMFCEQAKVFNSDSASTNDVINVGEKALITCTLSTLSVNFYYNLFTHCLMLIILVPKVFSIKRLSNGILTFGLDSILAEISQCNHTCIALTIKKVGRLFQWTSHCPPWGFLRTFFCHWGYYKETKSVEFVYVAVCMRLTHLMTVL